MVRDLEVFGDLRNVMLEYARPAYRLAGSGFQLAVEPGIIIMLLISYLVFVIQIVQ